MGVRVMMLNLGVIDIPRQEFNEGKPVKTETPLMMSDLADILEEEYHIFEHFWQAHHEEISEDIVSAFAQQLWGNRKTASQNVQFLQRALSEAKHRFTRFLTMKEMDGIGYPGIPTQASLAGVNHRMEHPYAKRPPRPSFVDTSQYLASFIAWIE